jgi:hypothetical protein
MRLRRKLFIALGTVLAAAIVIPWIVHWRLRAINEAYIRELVARGEPMTRPQVTPLAVPAAENSADVFLRAAAQLAADTSLLETNFLVAMLPVVPGIALAGSQQTAAVGYGSTNSWAEIAAAVAQNQTALKLLQKVATHPAFDFHINYQKGLGDGMDFTNLHLIELKKAGRYLAAAAMLDLHGRDLDGAVSNQKAQLTLIYAMQKERYVVTDLVGMAMLSDAQRITWEILQATGITEAQLADLQNAWARVNYAKGEPEALAMERVTGEITLQQWRGSMPKIRHYLELKSAMRENMGLPEPADSLWEHYGTTAKAWLWQYWWSYPDELRSLKGFDVLLDTARFVVTNGGFQTALKTQEARLETLQITNVPQDIFSLTFSFAAIDDFHSLMSASILSLAGTTKRIMTAETARQMTITAIALQRFKLAHGHYPEHLAGLVPEFLTAVPPDPVDGHPLRYRRESGGTFLLYSVGENGVDDGGDPSPAGHGTPKTFFWQDSQALDWVWPQATTADGVQFIYTPATGAK